MNWQTLSDEALTKESQGGSLSAFEQLVFRYEGRIYAFVSQSCRNTMDAREITQDTFVRAYQAIAQYDSARPFSSWLFAIARRKTIDHFRSIRPAAEEPIPELADAHTPAEALAQSEERTGVWEQSRRLLPKVQFQALWLKYVEDLSVTEIAGALRKTQTHIKVLLFRARQTLARELRLDGRAVLPVKETKRDLNKTSPGLSNPRQALDLCLTKRKGAV